MLNRSKNILLLIFILLTSHDLYAVKSKDLFYSLKAPVAQSATFMRLRDNKVLFSSTPDKLLIPASLTKLVTSAAVLSYFSPHHQFETKLFYTGKKSESTIHGDLIIVGDGDPYLISEKLWQLAADLRHLGVRIIKGNIIIDNSIFNGSKRDKSRLSGQHSSTHAYDAPISAFGVNFNTFAIAIAPASKTGNKAMVEIDPYNPIGLAIINKTETTSKRRKKIAASRISPKNNHSQIVVTGSIPVDGKLKKIYRSVNDPVWASGEILRSFLSKEGITIKGIVRSGMRPNKAQFLHSIASYDVGYIVRGLNQFSNNYIADVMVKRLGYAYVNDTNNTQTAGTLRNGVTALTNFLKKDVKIQTPFTLKNGSGLDHNNRLSANQLIAILSHMNSRFDLFPEYLHSLPTSGINGTMKKRFQKGRTKKLIGMIRAKTGTLTQPITASGLAGYLFHKKHGLVAFAIIENGIKGRKQPNIYDLRKRQDNAVYQFLNRI